MIFTLFIFALYIISKAFSGFNLIKYSETLPNNPWVKYIYFWDMLYAIAIFAIMSLNNSHVIELPSVLILIIGLVPLGLFFTMEFKIDKKYLSSN